MAMRKFYVIVSLFASICIEAPCQLDPTFEAVLKRTLEDTLVSNEVFIKNLKSAYVFTNSVFQEQVLEYDSTSASSKEYYTLDSTLTSKLFSTGIGPVLSFLSADALGGLSKFEVDKVIVIDKFKKSNSRAKIVFHTTSCYSKQLFRYVRDKPIFKRFECELILSGNTWTVQSVKISKSSFKAIVR